VQLFGLDLIASPLAVFAYVIVVGIAYQLIMGLIIVFVRVQPIIVALSGYLALSGINLVILARPGGTAPDWMSSWGLGTTIFSPMLAILVAATAAWLILGRTAFFGHLRMMGFDERAAYASGVRIGIVRLGAHCIAGIFSGLAALSYTALIGSGDPTQGTTYTLIAVTALVLGGTSLAGGRGGVIGSLLGAINLFLIGYVLATFNFGGIQGFVTDLCYGVILVLSLLLTVALPYVQRFTRHLSPFLVFMVLGLGLAAVMLHEKFDYGPAADQATAVTAGLAAARTSGSFVFEYPGPGIGGAMSQEQKMAALLAVLLISLVIFLRVMVSEAKTRRMTPLLYASLAIIVVVGTWLLAAR
jgi:ribose transport system permease protein